MAKCCNDCLHYEICRLLIGERELCIHDIACHFSEGCGGYKKKADYAEVVRCKDCQHRGDDVHCPMCFEEAIEWDDDGYTEVDYVLHDHTTDDGFCDRGDRREGE